MRKHWLTGALVLLGTVAVTTLAPAQTTSNGPYYATPSWDQQLPAATRFIVLSNWNSEAVLDRETGLVWQRTPTTDMTSWSGALRFCHSLSLGNRVGWRLPALEELASLQDPTQKNPALPAGHPFQLTATEFWVATAGEGSPSFAYVADVNVAGFAALVVKNGSLTFPYWCVRGGAGVSSPQ